LAHFPFFSQFEAQSSSLYQILPRVGPNFRSSGGANNKRILIDFWERNFDSRKQQTKQRRRMNMMEAEVDE